MVWFSHGNFVTRIPRKVPDLRFAARFSLSWHRWLMLGTLAIMWSASKKSQKRKRNTLELTNAIEKNRIRPKLGPKDCQAWDKLCLPLACYLVRGIEKCRDDFVKKNKKTKKHAGMCEAMTLLIDLRQISWYCV